MPSCEAWAVQDRDQEERVLERMIAEPHTHEQVIEAEVAIEILNKAQALLTKRIHQIEGDNPAEVERLLQKQIEIHELLRSIKVADDAGVKAITEYWGQLTKDEAAFWAAIDAWAGLDRGQERREPWSE